MKTTIYIGPSLKGGILKQYTVFRDGVVPQHVASLFERNDALRGLVVMLDDLQEARTAMLKKGNILNLYASRVKKEI